MLCFAPDLADQERTGFRYHYSLFQAEYSRNLLFTSGQRMDRVLQPLIDRTPHGPLDLRTVKTLFGRRQRPSRDAKPFRHHRHRHLSRILNLSLDKTRAGAAGGWRERDRSGASRPGGLLCFQFNSSLSGAHSRRIGLAVRKARRADSRTTAQGEFGLPSGSAPAERHPQHAPRRRLVPEDGLLYDTYRLE